MYTYDWFMLRVDEKQQNYLTQLSFNQKNKLEIKKRQPLSEPQS